MTTPRYIYDHEQETHRRMQTDPKARHVPFPAEWAASRRTSVASQVRPGLLSALLGAAVVGIGRVVAMVGRGKR